MHITIRSTRLRNTAFFLQRTQKNRHVTSQVNLALYVNKMYCPICQNKLKEIDDSLYCEKGNAQFPEMAKDLICEGLKHSNKNVEVSISENNYYSCPNCRTQLSSYEKGFIGCKHCGFKTKASLHHLLTERMDHEK